MGKQKGTIGVTTENIFPIIKKFLYSEHEIFLRELVSNAVDATHKMKALANAGEFSGDLGDITVRVSLDKEAKTITISDAGIGMTEEEIDKYINQIAFSSANEFLDKYKNQIENIIGHFGLGFYSSFMVSKQVDIITKSWKDDSKAVKWSCDGSPEYSLEEVEKETRGTDIVLHLDSDSENYADDNTIKELLTKFCKFLPVPIAFGKKTEWKDGKEVELDEDNQINNTDPAWTKKPADLKEEDYNGFYKELYPMTFEDPLFNIHLNVDYPFNLTGILYFPKITNNIEVQKNKIQLYCNQVFVTDSVEGIVPEFLTLLHGVLDSPDIPLNVSRSYLQGDPNVKKISSHITKKVADRLAEIFKKDRAEFEKKWDDLKLFITYGMLTEEKFYDKAVKFLLLKNTEGKYFTIEEYQKLVEGSQTDKDKKVVVLYAQDVDAQHTFIEDAKGKGYDVVILDGQLDSHFVNHLEQKFPDMKFTRVDSDVVDNLIAKEEARESKFSKEEEDELRPVFQGQLADESTYFVSFEAMSADSSPIVITQNEFMRRMKDMQKTGGGGPMGMYGAMPDNYNMVVNANHPLVEKIAKEKEEKTKAEVEAIKAEIAPLETELAAVEEKTKDKKEEEIEQADKDKKEELNSKIQELNTKKDGVLKAFGKDNKVVGQLIDLALLANGMLKGEALTKFVKRSVSLID